jgi:hypothetical protein
VHKVVCLELDTFQELRGQGQISDINKVDTWHNFRYLLFYLFFLKSKGVNLYLEVNLTKDLCIKINVSNVKR